MLKNKSKNRENRHYCLYSNIELFEKASKVINSCETLEQFKVAEKYYTLAQKFIDTIWVLDLIPVYHKKRLKLEGSDGRVD